jgi:hypothetical protein
MPNAAAGTMIQCDPTIVAVIEKINGDHSYGFISDCLNDEHILIQPGRVDELKSLVKTVGFSHLEVINHSLRDPAQALKGSTREASDNDSSSV